MSLHVFFICDIQEDPDILDKFLLMKATQGFKSGLYDGLLVYAGETTPILVNKMTLKVGFKI